MRAVVEQLIDLLVSWYSISRRPPAATEAQQHNGHPNLEHHNDLKRPEIAAIGPHHDRNEHGEGIDGGMQHQHRDDAALAKVEQPSEQHRCGNNA